MKTKLLLMTLLAVSATFVGAQNANKIAPKGKTTVSSAMPATNNLELSPVAVQMQQGEKAQLLKDKDKVEILSSKRMANGAELQVVKYENGRIGKRFVGLDKDTKIVNRKERVAKAIAKAEAKAATRADDRVFFESFEAWDGKATDWIPSNWTEKNAEGNIPTAKDNYTWHATLNSQLIATDGKYEAWVSFSVPTVVDQVEIAPAIKQDEWLISPEIAIKENNRLFFDLAISPLFIYLDAVAFEINRNKIVFNMEVLISTDNGSKWTKLWDAERDFASKLSDEELWDYMMAKFDSYSIDLSSYAGKNVKIAFRYTGSNGDAVALDAVSVDVLHPVALYQRPDGYFIWGLTRGWNNAAADALFGPAYTPAMWYNYSNEAKEFEWTFTNPNDLESLVTISDAQPIISYPLAKVYMPILKAKSDLLSSTYFWGTAGTEVEQPATANLLQQGGDTKMSWGRLGVGNYDYRLGLTSYYFADKDYCYGTGPDNFVDAVANYFEKPLHKYALDSVWISLGAFAAPANAEFKLVIHRVNDAGMLTDTIAVATCFGSEVINEGDHYTMPFGFKGLDELGFETPIYLEIEDAILIEMTGFNNNPDIELAVMSDAKIPVTYESNAYVFLNRKLTDGTIKRVLTASPNYLRDGYYSLHFNLHATYSYLLADGEEFDAPATGGAKTFNVATYYSPDGWYSKEVLDWVKVEYTFNQETWATTLTLTADALPAGVKGRVGDVTIATKGADMTFHVTQGDVVGITSSTVSPVKVVKTSDSFELSYPSDVTSVTIYNVSGQAVSQYDLSTKGSFSIPTSSMDRGVYIVKFFGDSVHSVKVVR